MACTVGAESWGREYVESSDPIRREAARQIIEEAVEADQRRMQELAVTLFGRADG